MTKFILASLIGLMAATGAQAQNTYYWPAPAAPSDGKVMRSRLPIGTPVMMRTLTQVSTKDNVPGDRIYLEVAENVSVGDHVVIPVGSPVLAEVAATQRNGHFGKKGKIEIRLIEVQTPSGPVRLLGTSNDEGVSGTVASFATIILVSPLGFLIHGTSALIPPGTPVQGQLGADLRYSWYANEGREQTAQADSATPSPTSFNF